ncbi:MAG: alkaline shock response membrane anchor protein AmaP [Pelosinus sp.]|nr:alkaline shock response membrane anchor protein AmaP [Pelosinus sp.]
MGIIDRIILLIYTLLLIILSVGVILMSLCLIPWEVVSATLQSIYGQWEAALAAGVFLLVSIRLLLASFRSNVSHSNEAIVHHTDMGDVQITLDAVKNLVEKTARHTRGVRDVKVYIRHFEEGLKVQLRIVTSPENNVPAVSLEIQQRVHEYIKNTVGIELSDIHILVENISNDFKAKQRVK